MIEALFQNPSARDSAGMPTQAAPVSFSVRGRDFLYDPNDMRLFRCDPDARARTLLQAGRFQTRKPQFELPLLRPKMIVLVLTHACNLRCRYCFHGPQAGRAEKRSAHDAMPRETAERALDLVPPGTDFSVGFFGGEPLLCKDRLREIVADATARARHRAAGVRFSLTTNGVLLDDETARFLDENAFSLIVSLDGPPHIHDRDRPDAAGKPTHARVLAALATVARFPGLARKTTLRATFAGDDTRLLERLEHLNDRAEEFGLGNVSVEPADITEGCAAKGAEPVVMNAELEQAYFDAAAWWMETLRQGRRPRFHHLAVRMERLLRRTPQPSECGAGCGYLAVNSDGEIFACHREGESRIGTLDNGVDTERRAPWRDNRYYARAKCGSCWLRNVCGGGCRLNSIHTQGDIRTPDPLGCAVTEVCVKAAAWTLSEMTGTERELFARNAR
jgi:uncharacterized protein